MQRKVSYVLTNGYLLGIANKANSTMINNVLGKELALNQIAKERVG
jgi:hypothetical protein